jgi:hypothetical protein
MQFEYRIFRSVNGVVASATGPAPLLNVLNLFGEHGGELVSAVSDGPGSLIVFIKHAVGLNIPFQGGIQDLAF